MMIDLLQRLLVLIVRPHDQRQAKRTQPDILMPNHKAQRRVTQT